MPAIIALAGRMLTWLVTTYLGQWILKALVAVGLTVVVHKAAMPNIMAAIQSYAGGLPAFYFQAFGALGFDVAISMIISTAIAVAAGKMAVRAAASA